MAVKVRRQYAGGAAATTLGGSLASSGVTTFSIASATGWPASTTIPFYVVVSPQTSSEEKMLVTLNGTTVTVVTRGVDGTTANTHASGASIYPVVTAVDLDEANELAATYANQGGIVYQGASTFTQLAIGTAGHVMKVNSGATAPEWGQVATAGIADSTITLAKLASAVANALVPVGTIAMYGGASAPTGWLLCDGTSTTGYPTLAGIVGSTTPDLRGRFAIGDNASLTLLATGGSATITEANLPSHTHTFSATSGSSTTGITLSTTGAHVHTINGEGFVANVQDVLNGDGQRVLESDLSTSASTEDTGSAGSHTHTVTDSGHTHSVSGTTGNGSGSGTAYYPPHLVVNYIIKHD